MTIDSTPLLKPKYFILCFFVLLCTGLNAQKLPIDRKVYSLENVDVEGINIYNRNTQQGVITDSQGDFKIAVSLGDTLSISAVHLQEATVIIQEEQVSNRKIIIELDEKMNQLATVTIRRGLTGYLGTDINLIPSTKPITAESVGIPIAIGKPMIKEERLLYAANSGPVDAIINMISGRTKMLKKQLELYKTTERTQSLLKKFPETYFTEVLKISKFQIYSFLFFCEDDPDYASIVRKDTITITEFLERKSQEFREK